ncbi:MAG: hypothetical protein AAF351_12350 [Pseudomonadota bacterium]
MTESNQPETSRGVAGYFVPTQQSAGNGGTPMIDFGQLWQRFRLLLILAPLVTAVLFFAASYLLTPQYRVTVTLAPVDHSSNSLSSGALGGALGGLSSLAGINLGQDGSRFESIAVLTSKALTTQFINEDNLLPILFAGQWDNDADAWKEPGEDAPSLEDGFREFDQDIRSIASDRESGLVTLSITWSDRNQAADWANHLVSRANSVIRARAIDEYQRSIEYLNNELENTKVVGVRQAIYSVIESQIEQVMLANVRTDYAFKVLDPAVAPDVDDFATPSRPLFALAGLVFGLLAALGFAISRLR